MIGYLRGQVLEHSDGKLLLTIGGADDAGAVGYLVMVPNSPSYLSFQPGKKVELFIYTHVREDQLDLYGFASRGEKELFLTLLSVNGIGPKGALGVLSKIDPAQLIQIVMDGDKDSLVAIPGIGKKTAERIVVELADSLRKKVESGQFSEVRSTPAAATAQGKLPLGASVKPNGDSAIFQDAKEALVGLGYREPEVAALLNRVIKEKGPARKVEDLIRTALQQLG